MVDPSVLLVEKLDELALLAAHSDPAVARRIAAVLRQLLADGDKSVVSQARRANPADRTRLLFSVTQLPVPTREWLAHDDIDPEASPDYGARELREDQFLRMPVAFVEGTIVRVIDVIKYGANVAGGIHAGTPQAVDLAIAAVEERYPNCVVHPTLRPVARIVLRATRRMRYQLQRLDRFVGAPGLGYCGNVRIENLDVDGDIQLATFGTDPLMRLIVDRDAMLRVIATSGSEKHVVAAAPVPIRRRFAAIVEVGCHGDDLLFRVYVDGVEHLRVLPRAARPAWVTMTDPDRHYMQLGHSRHGTFALGDVVVVGRVLSDTDRTNHLRFLASRGPEGIEFGPGRGVATKRPGQ